MMAARLRPMHYRSTPGIAGEVRATDVCGADVLRARVFAGIAEDQDERDLYGRAFALAAKMADLLEDWAIAAQVREWNCGPRLLEDTVQVLREIRQEE